MYISKEIDHYKIISEHVNMVYCKERKFLMISSIDVSLFIMICSVLSMVCSCFNFESWMDFVSIYLFIMGTCFLNYYHEKVEF